MKDLRVAVFVLLVAGLLAAIGWFWATRSVRRLESTRDAAVEEARAEQASIRRQPLRGEAREGVNAADEYRAVLQPMAGGARAPTDPSATTTTADRTLGQRIHLAPAPVPGWLAPFAAARATAVAAIREATRAERCDWRPVYEEGGRPSVPPLVPARIVSRLLILDGQQRELAGDPRGAAERYLDGARFGADLGDVNLTLAEMSVSFAVESLGALARLLGAGTLAAGDLREVERELAILEPELPEARRTLRGERAITLARCLENARADSPRDHLGSVEPPISVPSRGALAVLWSGCDRIFLDFADAFAIEDFKAREARLAALDRDFQQHANPLARIVTPDIALLRHSIGHVHALACCARAAAAIARFRLEKGAYPATLADAIAPPPGDPFAAAELRYARADDGAGAKVWSVGADGVDDGGRPGPDWEHGDIVVELGATKP